MPVDKFGRMDEVKPSEDGISISYVNNNFLRKDGTTEVTSSINMNGNTLTRVSNPANPHDVATKDYVDSAAGLLRENGDYHILGHLNMGFNKIKNLHDPTEPGEAANKKYVDESERAIIKRNDGSFSATANINMRGYQLTNLLNPAEPQDVATKNYVDSANRAFVYGRGEYIATLDISMGGRRINNIGTPLEVNQAANKSYVDLTVLAATGGAVLKRNPDGTFTSNRGINMNGKRITNLPEPYGNYDPVTKFYLTKRLLATSAHIIDTYMQEIPKPIISIHAEEQGPLSNGNYEFSFGNGSSGRSHGLGGYCMSAPGRIIRGSLTVLKGNDFLEEEAKINVVINGIEKTDYSLIKEADKGCSCAVFPNPLELNQCDIINFLTKTDNPGAKNSYITILVELDL